MRSAKRRGILNILLGRKGGFAPAGQQHFRTVSAAYPVDRNRGPYRCDSSHQPAERQGGARADIRAPILISPGKDEAGRQQLG